MSTLLGKVSKFGAARVKMSQNVHNFKYIQCAFFLFLQDFVHQLQSV